MQVKYHVEMRYLDRNDKEHRAVVDVWEEDDATSESVKQLAEKEAGIDKKAYSGHAFDTWMSRPTPAVADRLRNPPGCTCYRNDTLVYERCPIHGGG